MVSISRLFSCKPAPSAPAPQSANTKLSSFERLIDRIKISWESFKSKLFRRPVIRSTTTFEILSLKPAESTRMSRLCQKVSNYFLNKPEEPNPKVYIEMQFMKTPAVKDMINIVTSRSSKMAEPKNMSSVNNNTGTSADSLLVQNPYDNPNAFMHSIERELEKTADLLNSNDYY